MTHPQSSSTPTIRRARHLHDGGELGEAERLYRAALQRDPANFDALHLLGMLNYQRGRLDSALALIRAALQVDPWRADAHSDLGLVLYASGSFAEALESYDAAHALQPDDPDALNGRGVALLQLDRLAEALASFDCALALAPAHLDALGNRGNVLLRLNRPEEAILSYEAGLRIVPEHARLLTNQAIALSRLDRSREALLCLSRALVSAPSFAEPRFVESLLKLTLGELRAGWKGYESRWETVAFAPQRRSFAAPLWLGDCGLAGKTILLHAEQGYGDTIQFVRYAPLVAQLGARVVLEVQPQLADLLSPMKGIDIVIPRGQSLPAFDLHCPLMSLPLAMKTELFTIPADVPYLVAPDRDVGAWQRLPIRRPRVGLVWAGDKWHKNDVNRSMRLDTLWPLLDLPEFQFVSLQQEICAEDAELLEHCPRFIQAGRQFRDFSETAAVIARLDAVVAVDTAVAHLVGAMGKPLYLLLPFAADFRWLRERRDSPWYPSARLFRQHRFGDWGKAVDLLRRELIWMGRQWSDDRIDRLAETSGAPLDLLSA